LTPKDWLPAILAALLCAGCGSSPSRPSTTVAESACVFGVAPTNITASSAGGAVDITVTVADGRNCAWTAASGSPFVTVASGGSGTGNGQVSIAVSENTDVSRTGTLTIAGQTVFVNQGAPTGIVRERLTGRIGAETSPVCSDTFKDSVHPNYYFGGTQRCVEFARRSVSTGQVIARLTWQDVRIDLDLVLNDGKGSNFRQSIAANRCCETVEFVLNGGTDYVFVVYLRGVDELYRSRGGTFAGEVATPFTLEIERPR
jgi:hypothetical protein